MIALWPSIDLMDGQVVRLLHGDRDRRTNYASDPVSLVRAWEAEGADGIHVVDLDAAFGTGSNAALVRDLVTATRLPVQVGGGLRTRESVGEALEAGAARVVLGSLPFSDRPTFERILASHGSRIVVALDCREGRPMVKGWTETAEGALASGAAAEMEDLGVAALLVTDVARDGALAGPNLELLSEVRSRFRGEVLASGGMRDEADLGPAAEALRGGPCGAILGRALHEGRTTVARLRASREEGRKP